MSRRSQSAPLRGLLIRLGGIGGLIFGFANGVIHPVNNAMNCSADGVCDPDASGVGMADIFVPMGLGVAGGMALGLVIATLIARFVSAR